MRSAVVWLRYAMRHVGRRGGYLTFLALVDVTVAYALLQPLPLNLDRRPFYAPFVAVMPLSWWAAWWLGTGLLAAAAAVCHALRPVTFSAAAALKTVWGLGYLAGWVLDLPAFTRGYQTAMIYTAFALVTLLVAGWRENDQ